MRPPLSSLCANCTANARIAVKQKGCKFSWRAFEKGLARGLDIALRARVKHGHAYCVGQKMIASFVKKKSAIRIAIDTTTTVRVVLLPTPAVPPRVVMPK